MKINVHTKATLDSIDKAVKAKSKAVQRMLKVNGQDMVDTIKRNLGLNRSQYRQYGNHWSSRPNEYPNTDTGWLKASVALSRKVVQGSVYVIVSAKYARALEFGTRKIRKRPFVKPVRDAKQKLFKIRILRAMRNA